VGPRTHRHRDQGPGRQALRTYVALLRGINVGGHGIMPMKAVVKVFEKLGFTNVRTYIASGNVIFETAKADPRKLEATIEAAMSKAFRGYNAKVVVRSKAELETVLVELPKSWQRPKREDPLQPHLSARGGRFEVDPRRHLSEARCRERRLRTGRALLGDADEQPPRDVAREAVDEEDVSGDHGTHAQHRAEDLGADGCRTVSEPVRWRSRGSRRYDCGMATDGDDPPDSKPPQPPSTLAGVVPQPPRHGLPPPRVGQRLHSPSQSPLPAQPRRPSQPPPHAQPGQPPYAQPPAPQPYQQQRPVSGAPQGYPESQWGPGVSESAAERSPQSAPLPEAVVRPRRDEPSSPIQQIAEVFEEVPGKFIDSLKMATKRAFRLRIEPSEITVKERAALTAANPPIVDENLQAFLAWRRSVLFLVATFLLVLSVIGLVDGLIGSKVPGAIRFVKLTPALAETAFCAICWLALRNWTDWRKQRRWLFFGWALFMLSPFVVFVYPLKLAVLDATRAMTIEQMRELGYYGVYNRVVAPFVFAMIAMLQLAQR
jgi:uncharacterized protein (DUF1697 family)